MALIPWRPFDELENFFNQDNFFPVIPTKIVKEPKMNIYETDKEIIAEIEIPGIDPLKMDISLTDNILTVKGGEEGGVEEKGKNYWKKEFKSFSFERTVRLPVKVDENRVKATSKDGVLKVVMPKVKQAKKEKKIKVKVEKK